MEQTKNFKKNIDNFSNLNTAGKSKSLTIFLKILACIFVGLVNGLFGGGGGMVCVPMLMCLFDFEEKNAHATTILIMLISSISTLVGYSVNMPTLYQNWKMMIAVGIGVMVGGICGAFALKKIQNEILQKGFAVVMLLAGLYMIFK